MESYSVYTRHRTKRGQKRIENTLTKRNNEKLHKKQLKNDENLGQIEMEIRENAFQFGTKIMVTRRVFYQWLSCHGLVV
jgi:hypothetical protein